MISTVADPRALELRWRRRANSHDAVIVRAAILPIPPRGLVVFIDMHPMDYP